MTILYTIQWHKQYCFSNRVSFLCKPILKIELNRWELLLSRRFSIKIGDWNKIWKQIPSESWRMATEDADIRLVENGYIRLSFTTKTSLWSHSVFVLLWEGLGLMSPNYCHSVTWHFLIMVLFLVFIQLEC